MDHLVQKSLFQALHRAIEWPLIEAGLTCGLFDSLTTAQTSDSIAEQFNWHPKRASLYLDALTSLNLIEKRLMGYQLHPDYVGFLETNQSNSMRDTLLHLSGIKLANAHDLLTQLRKDYNTEPQFSFDRAEFWLRSTDNLRSFHRSVASDFCAHLLRSLPEWKNIESLLDIGAGSEILAQILTQSKTCLRYHIFDLPQVIEQLSLSFDHNEKITLHAGDYNQKVLPRGFDLVFASMSLYYAKDLIKLLADVYDSVNQGGLFVSLHEGLTEHRTQPTHHVIGRLLPAIRGNDVSFERGTIAQHMLKVGFKRVHSQSVSTPFGPMELDIAYK